MNRHVSGPSLAPSKRAACLVDTTAATAGTADACSLALAGRRDPRNRIFGRVWRAMVVGCCDDQDGIKIGTRGADADRKSGVVEIGPICQAIDTTHWTVVVAKSGERML